MVLLLDIISNSKGVYIARTEKGANIKIIGIPYLRAVPIIGEDLIDKELEKLERLARKDKFNYYLIQSKREILENKGTHEDAFAISYAKFMKPTR
ncbi:hypothetical protein GOV13_01665 [Candidatus Pacearchaeota archaeon]|nr:hypothetical protein [Candidatus Pacearchaeota archaeon]